MSRRSGRIPRMWDRAVLTANIGVPIGAGRLTRNRSRLHQFPCACLIRLEKGIVLIGPAVIVRGREFTGFIAAEAEDHPDQIAGHERIVDVATGRDSCSAICSAGF